MAVFVKWKYVYAVFAMLPINNLIILVNDNNLSEA